MMIERLIEIGLSCLTLTTVWLAGSKHSFTPYLGFVSELCWLLYILYMGLYGLLFMAITLVVLYIRMGIKWRKK